MGRTFTSSRTSHKAWQRNWRSYSHFSYSQGCSFNKSFYWSFKIKRKQHQKGEM